MTYSTDLPNPEKRPKLLPLLAALLAVHQIEATDRIVKSYLLALGDIPDDRATEAIMRALKELPHMPKPSEIRQLAGLFKCEESYAIEAWNEVLKAVSVGPYKTVDFVDSRINATIRNMGGWPSFTKRFDGAEGEKWTRQEFIKAYRLLGRYLSAEATRPLGGITEKEVVAGKLVDPVPVRIACGNPERRLTHIQSSYARSTPRIADRKEVDEDMTLAGAKATFRPPVIFSIENKLQAEEAKADLEAKTKAFFNSYGGEQNAND